MADGVIDNVEDLSWFAAVLAQSQEVLDGMPESCWPSWYKQHVADRTSQGLHPGGES